MAKLTRAQEHSLRSILRHLTRAHGYIQQDQIVLATKATQATTTLHLSRPASDAGPALVVYPLAKDIGSDLVGLGMGIKQLRSFLGETE